MISELARVGMASAGMSRSLAARGFLEGSVADMYSLAGARQRRPRSTRDSARGEVPPAESKGRRAQLSPDPCGLAR